MSILPYLKSLLHIAKRLRGPAKWLRTGWLDRGRRSASGQFAEATGRPSIGWITFEPNAAAAAKNLRMRHESRTGFRRLILELPFQEWRPNPLPSDVQKKGNPHAA